MCQPTEKFKEKPRAGQEKVAEVPFISLTATQTEIEPKFVQVNMSFPETFSKDPQAQHLLWLPSLNHHPCPSSCAQRRPLCRAPGLCSFLADADALQVDVRQGCVDFQRFGEGLWPKAMASRKTCDAIYKDTSDAGWTLNYVTVGTNKKLKYKGQMLLKEGKAKKVELQLHESGKQCPNFPTNSWILRIFLLQWEHVEMSRNKRCWVRKEILRNFNRNSMRCSLFNRKLQTKGKLSTIKPNKAK